MLWYPMWLLSFCLVGSPLRTLRDGTPFDEQAGSDLFRIVPSGKGGIIKAPAQYVGPVYRRMEPDASRYVALTPGASVRAEIDLSVDYEIPVGGAYRIAYTGNFNVIRDGVRLLRSAHPVKMAVAMQASGA